MNGGKCTKVGVLTKGHIWPTGLVLQSKKVIKTEDSIFGFFFIRESTVLHVVKNGSYH